MPSISQDGALLCAGKTEIETASGVFMDVRRPRPADVRVEDIAHALSLLCRYGGHSRIFYSVAEHSILVHDLLVEHARESNRHVTDAERTHALLHDASEAYLGDVVAPLKKAMRDPTSSYDPLSDRMDECIRDALLLAPPEHDVAFYDLWALRVEARALLPSRGRIWRWPESIPTRLPDRLRPKWVPGSKQPHEVASLYETMLRGLLR